MNNASVWFEQVGDRIKMRDVISLYVTRTDKEAGRIPCPFHNGKDRNLSYSPDLWQCWVCGEKGNTITFVAKLFGLSNIDALRKIDEDFGLGIVGKHVSLKTKRKIEAARTQRAKESREEERYRKCCEELHDINEYLRKHEVTEITDELSEMIHRRSYLEAEIEELWEVISGEC